MVGPQYKPRSVTVGAVTTDESGGFDKQWTIPEDFGGGHRIEVTDGNATLAWAEIEIELSGVGWTAFENTRFFNYDNRPLGYACGLILSAITS